MKSIIAPICAYDLWLVGLLGCLYERSTCFTQSCGAFVTMIYRWCNVALMSSGVRFFSLFFLVPQHFIYTPDTWMSGSFSFYIQEINPLWCFTVKNLRPGTLCVYSESSHSIAVYGTTLQHEKLGKKCGQCLSRGVVDYANMQYATGMIGWWWTSVLHFLSFLILSLNYFLWLLKWCSVASCVVWVDPSPKGPEMEGQ